MATDHRRSSPPSEYPGGQTPLSRADYDALRPEQQGYVSYYQGAWNKQVPDKPHYPLGSKQHAAWQRGRVRAAIEVQEGDEC